MDRIDATIVSIPAGKLEAHGEMAVVDASFSSSTDQTDAATYPC